MLYHNIIIIKAALIPRGMINILCNHLLFLIRFVTDCPQKYVGLFKSKEGEAKPKFIEGEAKPKSLEGEAKPKSLQGEAKSKSIKGEAKPKSIEGEATPKSIEGEAN